MIRRLLAAGALACALPPPALAQTVAAPAGFVPSAALAYGAKDGAATFVTRTTPLPTTQVTAEATSCSGSLAVGGTAQPLFAAGIMANGGAVQNQSSGPLYIRSRSATGAVNATPDQNSLLIPAGGYYEFPHVTANASSIVGPTTGQAFYCRTW